jgi:2-polyprenyl-6-methoxyphenol hydroxylase-like FAD-dependent oxidoreductase
MQVHSFPRAASRVLIVGAGPAGLSSAIALRKAGLDVEVVDAAVSREGPGSELMLGGSMLRALDVLGVADRCVSLGVGLDATTLCSADGQVVADIPMPRIARPDLPLTAGITRNNLVTVLRDAAEAHGAVVRYGTSVQHLATDSNAAHVTFTNGDSDTYDLVVGADGVWSTVRRLVFPDAPHPRPTGQAVWRARVPRLGPPALIVAHGPRNKAGYITVSTELQYLFCVVNTPWRQRVPEARFPELLRAALAEYDGLIGDARDQVVEREQVHYSILVNLMLPAPWHRGRVLLIGDAAHACTPHLAYGAGIAVEDGVVLGQVLGSHTQLSDALEAFMQRRYERCRMVVHNAQQIGEWEQQAENPHAAALSAELTERSWAALAEPI